MRNVLLALLCLAGARASAAEPVRILAAANFRTCLEELAAVYTQETGQVFRLSTGATGQLFAQINSGAPCDLFFAADSARPRRLVAAGKAPAADCRTYALGRLVLFYPRATPGTETFSALLDLALQDQHTRLAIANPELAPYGRAARQSLQASGHWEAVQPRLVRGQSVGQAWQFVASGAVQLGLVSLAQQRAAERSAGDHRTGTVVLVPPAMYDPIRQQVVLLASAPQAARAFFDFVLGPEGQAVCAEFGYGVPTP